MVIFTVGTNDGQRSRFIPDFYASVCLCAEPSVSLVVPILSFLTQVTNSLISTYEKHSWHYCSWCKCHCDVHEFLFFLFFFFFTCFWHFSSASLAFINMSLNVICCLCHRLPAALKSKLSAHTHATHAYIHVFSCCNRCFLTVCLSLIFLIRFFRAIRCCKVPPCSSYSKCRCNHRAHLSR